jgi:hypothetical protein
MQVVVIPDRRAPVVTHMIWYKAGYGDELQNLSGVAQFLTHLSFRSLDKICEGGYEDIHDDIKVPDGLLDLIKKFNDMNAHLISWRIDHTRKVKMPPLDPDCDRYQEELAKSEMDMAADLNHPQEPPKP